MSDANVDASIAVHDRDQSLKPGLTEVLSAIRPPSGLFVLEEEKTGPLSTALCVHDNDLAGLFELATRSDVRRAGYGRDVVRAALRWARHRGADTAWLQVEERETQRPSRSTRGSDLVKSTAMPIARSRATDQ